MTPNSLTFALIGAQKLRMQQSEPGLQRDIRAFRLYRSTNVSGPKGQYIHRISLFLVGVPHNFVELPHFPLYLLHLRHSFRELIPRIAP